MISNDYLTEEFEAGIAYGKWKLTQELNEYAKNTNDSRVIEILYNALYIVEKDK